MRNDEREAEPEREPQDVDGHERDTLSARRASAEDRPAREEVDREARTSRLTGPS